MASASTLIATTITVAAVRQISAQPLAALVSVSIRQQTQTTVALAMPRARWAGTVVTANVLT